MFVPQSQAENEELKQELSEVSAQHNSVLEENQRLRAKLENLEQVLKVLFQPSASLNLFFMSSRSTNTLHLHLNMSCNFLCPVSCELDTKDR